MTLEIDFLPFATGVGAGVESQSSWVSDTVVVNGFITGTALNTQVNKAIRQPSFVSAAIANYMANVTNQNILDNGVLNTFWSQFWESLLLGSAFTDTGSVNALAVTAPFGLSFPAPINGLKVTVKVANTNTGAVTFNWMGNGAVSVVYSNLVALPAGSLTAGGYATLVYDGTYWQLLDTNYGLALTSNFSNRPITLTSNYTIVAGDGGKNFKVTNTGVTVTVSSSYLTSNNGPVVVCAIYPTTITCSSGVFAGGSSGLNGLSSFTLGVNSWIAFEPDGTNFRVVAGDPTTIGAPGNFIVNNEAFINTLQVTSPSTFLSNLTVYGVLTVENDISLNNSLFANGVVTCLGGTASNQAVVFNQFPFSVSGNGYISLPNGFYLMWGNGTAPLGGSTGAFAFPTAFPHACLAVIGSLGYVIPGASPIGFGINAVNNAQFYVTLATTISGTDAFWYIAVGY